MRNSAEPVLLEIAQTFPEYTIHDLRHKDKVCEILGWLIPPSILELMPKYEVFFLIAATYLHDIGMADIPDIFDQSKFSEWVASQSVGIDPKHARQDFIREFHHIRSEGYINQHFSDLGISNAIEAFVIGRIARGHRSFEELHDFEAYPRKFIYRNEAINMAHLGFFLQVADELDFGFERAPLLLYRTFNPKNPISKIEWEKNLSTSGAHLDPNDSRVILVSALCKSEKVHRALFLLEGKIQLKLDTADQILDPYANRLFANRIKVQITNLGYDYLDLEFIFDMNAILPLLTRRVYSRNEEAIRELLQNAIDACHYRLDICRKEHRDYNPFIIVRSIPSEDGDILEIEDNGVGMDHHALSSYFGKIGRSFYASQEFLAQSPSFFPISEFGIGILSAFMIADKVVIETKTDSSTPYKIEIFPWDEHIFVTGGDKSFTGTSVKLSLKRDFKVNVVEEVSFYARHVDIPIHVKSGPAETVINQKWSTYEDFSNKNRNKSTDMYKPLTFEIRSDNYDCLISIPSQEDHALGRVPVDLTHVVSPDAANLIAISKNGIFVEFMDLYDLAKNWGLIASIDLDIHTSEISLSLGRNAIKRDTPFKQLVSDMIDQFLLSLSSLFDEYIRLDGKQFGHESFQLMSSIFNFFAFDHFSQKTKDFIARYGGLVAFDSSEFGISPNHISISALNPNDIFLSYHPGLTTDEVARLLNCIDYEKLKHKSVNHPILKPVANAIRSTRQEDGSFEYPFIGRYVAATATSQKILQQMIQAKRLIFEKIDLSDILLFKRSYPGITINTHGLKKGTRDQLADIEIYSVDFVNFTSCKPDSFVIAVEPPMVDESTIYHPYSRMTINQHLLINMQSGFAQVVRKVFGGDFLRVIRPVIEALVTQGYDSMLEIQKKVLQDMQSRGICNTDALRLRTEDIPSFLI